MGQLLVHLLGLDSASGRSYLFWSGIGSDIGELGIVGALVANLRKHNCHVHRCWRIGRHRVTGTDFTVCRRHHPDDHITAGQVLANHATALNEIREG